MLNYEAVSRTLPEIAQDKNVPMAQISRDFDLDQVLSISLIRTHTKTDDVPHVTDEQLKLYRRAALEAAQLYTGALFVKRAAQIETMESVFKQGYDYRFGMEYGFRQRTRVKYRTKLPVSDGIIYVYGSPNNLANRRIEITPGTRTFYMPISHIAVDDRSCCGPCGGGGPLSGDRANYGMKMTYMAGYVNEQAIPGGIIMGCLKFIAWSIQNPGDEIMTVRNTVAVGQAGIVGTNNGAWASGAIEEWRMYGPDDI